MERMYRTNMLRLSTVSFGSLSQAVEQYNKQAIIFSFPFSQIHDLLLTSKCVGCSNV
jgi:hypothetical protein